MGASPDRQRPPPAPAPPDRPSPRARLADAVADAAVALLLYGVLTPAGWLLRALGRDALRLRRRPDAATYWIPRRPPGPAAGSMTDEH